MAQGYATQMSPSGTDGVVLPAEEVAQPGAVVEINRQSAGAQLTDQGSGNVDKIRDILFGVHIREYEARFTRLEEDLAKGLAELRETTNNRFEAIEAYLKSEFEALQGRLKTERDDRTNSLKQVARDLNELGESLGRRISDVEEQGLHAQRQLRLELLQMSKNFADDLGRKQEEITLLLDRRFQELRKGKTDRAALAALFTELGMRLNDEFHVPAAEK